MADDSQNPTPDPSDSVPDPAQASPESSDADSPSGELSQADIDAAVQAASASAPSADHSQSSSAADAASPQDDIDAVLAGAEQAAQSSGGTSPEPETQLDSSGRPFDEEAAAMAAAIAETSAPSDEPATAESAPAGLSADAAKPPDLPDFAAGDGSVETQDISILRDVNLTVQIELGRTLMYIEDVLKLGEGSVVELDNLAGDPVDVIVNGRLVARGEVLVLSDNFCVRINEIVTGPQNVAVA